MSPQRKGETSQTSNMFSNLGRTLILIRELRGKNQAQVARAAKIGKSQLSKYENGKELPKLESLERVLAALEIGQLDFFYTLDLITRRAGDLFQHSQREQPENPLQAEPDFRSGLLTGDTKEGFNRVMASLLDLYDSVLSESLNVYRHRRKEL